MIKSKITTTLTLVLVVVFSSPVRSAEYWEYTLSPLYLWATGIEGESQIGPVTAPVSIEFKDALDNLDTILTFHFEANKGNKGFIANLMHIGLDPESTLPNGAPIATDLTNNVLDLAGIYRPQNTETLEVLYGLRFTEFGLEATIGPAPTATIVYESWVDGFVGLRTVLPASDKGRFVLRGDIGAGDSDMVWSASGLFDYRFNDRFSALIGYRWLDYDYETGSGANRFTYDVTYEGPVMAAVFYW